MPSTRALGYGLRATRRRCIGFKPRKPGSARNALSAYQFGRVVRAASLRSAAIVTASRRSGERISVALPRARAGHPGGTETVNPARRLANVRHPGGGFAGGSFRSVAGSGDPANLSSSPQPVPARTAMSAATGNAVARTVTEVIRASRGVCARYSPLRQAPIARSEANPPKTIR